MNEFTVRPLADEIETGTGPIPATLPRRAAVLAFALIRFLYPRSA